MPIVCLLVYYVVQRGHYGILLFATIPCAYSPQSLGWAGVSWDRTAGSKNLLGCVRIMALDHPYVGCKDSRHLRGVSFCHRTSNLCLLRWPFYFTRCEHTVLLWWALELPGGHSHSFSPAFWKCRDFGFVYFHYKKAHMFFFPFMRP